MKQVTMHESGSGAEKLKVTSYDHGITYNILFGEAGSPMCNTFLQGNDAIDLRADIGDMYYASTETPDRDHWLDTIAPYVS